MIRPFDIVAPRKIVFGLGRIRELPALIEPLIAGTANRMALVVTGSDVSRHDEALRALKSAIPTQLVSAIGEPTVEQAEQAVALARATNVALVIAIGGGSALDLGKAIAALTPNPGSIFDYLEVVGAGQPLSVAPLPFVAIPTTSGTGSEATKNAVLAAPLPDGGRVKVSVRSDRAMPDIALVDPELTRSVPRQVTAATGLDALTQVIEPYVSHAATPFTDSLAREAIPRGAAALKRCVEDGDDLAARSEMALVSLYGGLALSNAKLGAVHGFAGPLGGLFDAAHGALCARLLPAVIETNLAALRARAPMSPALTRYGDIARWVTRDETAKADQAVWWFEHLVEELHIPTLSEVGMREDDIPRVAAQASKSSSMKGNPIQLSAEEMESILRSALG